MDVQQLSNGFDVYIQSYLTNYLAGYLDKMAFDEYEKSLFLTLAQLELAKEYYSGLYTHYESSEEVRRYLDELVKTKKYTQENSSVDILPEKANTYIHTIYNLPKDDKLWVIVYEQVQWGTDAGTCLSGRVADVYPATHDEYFRIHENPFRGPTNRRVIRLDKGNNLVELISKNVIGTYTIRYLVKPEPIILVPLPEDLAIEGKTNPQTCKLNEVLHDQILQVAVKLALASKTQTNSNNNKSNASE